MMACDSCGRIGGELHEVSEKYRTRKLGHICPRCKERADKYIRSLWKVTRRWETKKVREFMSKRATDQSTEGK